MNIFIDIETIPSQRNESKARAAAKVHPPGNISKAETLAKWDAEKRPGLEDAEWRKTSFNGAWGELCVIGWAIEDGPVQLAVRETIAEPEGELLERFFSDVADHFTASRDRLPHYVGHNLANFDLRFLWHRCVVLGVKPPIALCQDAPPWSDRVSDTMQMWAGNRGSIKLTELCEALRIDVGHEDAITGADVWDCYQRGDVDTIATHCRADVERVREVWRRMVWR